MATPREKIAEMLSGQQEEPAQEPAQESGDAERVEDRPTEPEKAQKLEEGEPSPGEGSESNDDVVEYFTDLAGHLDVEPEQLYSLKMKLAEGGDPITLGEVKDIVQEYNRRKGEFDQNQNRLRELEQQRSQWEQQYAQQQQQQSSINDLDEEGQNAWRAMVEAQIDFNRIDWDELEKIDAGKAALEKQKLLQKHAVSKKQVEEASQRMAQMRNQQFYQFKSAHDQELLKHVPEWQNQETARAQVSDIIQWAQQGDYRMTDEEMSQLVDWRHRDIMRKAFLYDQMMAEKSKLESKAPAQIKGGIRLKKSDVKTKQLGDMVKKARTGSRQDKTAAARAVLDQAFAKR